MTTCIHPRIAQRVMQNFVNDASSSGGIIVRKGKEFCAVCSEKRIEYSFDGLADEGMAIFRKYWAEKAPVFNEFSNATLSLLHELGHVETNARVRRNFTWKMRQLAWAAIDMQYETNEEKNNHYFEMPDEKAATEWAIEWLADANHKHIAKLFETQFLACFEQKA